MSPRVAANFPQVSGLAALLVSFKATIYVKYYEKGCLAESGSLASCFNRKWGKLVRMVLRCASESRKLLVFATCFIFPFPQMDATISTATLLTKSWKVLGTERSSSLSQCLVLCRSLLSSRETLQEENESERSGELAKYSMIFHVCLVICFQKNRSTLLFLLIVCSRTPFDPWLKMGVFDEFGELCFVASIWGLEIFDMETGARCSTSKKTAVAGTVGWLVFEKKSLEWSKAEAIVHGVQS